MTAPPIDVNDFKYLNWKTSDGTHCPKCGRPARLVTTQIKSMTGSDNGKTVTVVMNTPFADWQSMFGNLYPAHIAAQHGDVTTPTGLTCVVHSGSTRPSRRTPVVRTSSAARRQGHLGHRGAEPEVVRQDQAEPDKLIFRIITDQTQEVPALQNNEVQAIYPQPNADIVAAVGKIAPQTCDSYLGKGLTWEHLDFNENNQLLKDKVLRTAIFTAINRKEIIARRRAVRARRRAAEQPHVRARPGGLQGQRDRVRAGLR